MLQLFMTEYLLFYLVIGIGILIFLVWSSSGKKKPDSVRSVDGTFNQTFTLGEFKTYLQALKQEGKTTLDEVLKDIGMKIGELNGVKQEQASEEVETAAASTSPKPTFSRSAPRVAPIETSTMLLYLGAFVFSFAIFVFAAFTWNMYSNAFKILLIVLIPVAFWAAGWYFSNKQKYATASATFLFVGALATGFAGLGLWNFTGLKDSGMAFSTYWSVYGAILVALYGLVWELTGRIRYRWLFVVATYSFIGSSAFALVDSAATRVLFVILLNALFLAVSSLWKPHESALQKIPRTMAQALDIVGVLAVISLNLAAAGVDRYALLLVLIVPFLLDIYVVATKQDRANEVAEEGLAVLSFVPKVFLGLMIFTLTPPVASLWLAWALVVFGLFVEYRYAAKIGESLYNLSRVMIVVFAAFITLGILNNCNFWLDGNACIDYPSFSALLIASIVSIAVSLPIMFKRAKFEVGWGVLPLLLIVVLMFKATFAAWFIISAGVLLIVALASKGKFDTKQLQSLGEVLLLLAVLFGPSSIVVVKAVQLFVAAIMWGMFAIERGRNSFVFESIPFALFGSYQLFANFTDFPVDVRWMGLAFLLPAVVYGLLGLIPQLGRYVQQSVFVAVVIFSTIAILLTIGHPLVAMLSIGMVLYLAILFTVRLEESAIGYLIALLVLLWTGSLVGYLELTGGASILVFGATYFVSQLALLGLASANREGEDSLANRSVVAVSRGLLVGTVLSFLGTLQIIASQAPLGLMREVYSRVAGLLLMGGSVLVAQIPTRERRWAGIPAVLAAWVFAAFYETTSLGFALPLTIYLGLLAFWYQSEGDEMMSKIFEFFAVAIQGITLLGLSTTGTDLEQLIYGILLMLAAIGSIIAGNLLGRKALLVGGTVFLVLELVIRMWFLIVLIPWWVYLAVIGLCLMGAGIYAVSKK